MGMQHRLERLSPAPATTLAFALLFFACLQLSLDAALERGLPALRDREFTTKLTALRRHLAEHPGRPLVLVLGSSRVLTGLRPADLPRCQWPDRREPVVFNGGLIDAGPRTELVALNRLLAAGVRPDWLLVECWPPVEIAEEQRIPFRRLAWEDVTLLARFSEDRLRLFGEWGEYRLLPWYTNRATLMRAAAPGWLSPAARRDSRVYPIDPGGWAPCPIGATPEAQRRLFAEVHAHHAEVLRSFRPGPDTERVRRALLERCRREGIRVALLFLPEARDFQECYPPAVRAAVDRSLVWQSREYGVPFLDARNWVADADFADGQHLRPAGAAAFTARFGREVLPRLGRLP
jgi:hypothetical protein